MSSTLIILNDPPYGTERSYNGLRLAAWLSRRDGLDHRSTMDELTDWTVWANKVVVF